jgi:glycosyltransferase involved in cell wall biosynthesis
MRQKRVLMIGPCPFLINRGKSLRINGHLRALSDLGAKIDFFTYPDGGAVKYRNVTVFRASRFFRKIDPYRPGIDCKGFLSDVHLALKVTRCLGRRNYDAIHAHDADGAMIGLLSKKITFKKTPLIYDMHGSFTELNDYYQKTNQRGLLQKIENHLYDTSDFIILNWPHLNHIIRSGTKKTLIMDRPDEETYQHLVSKNLKYDNRFPCMDYVLYTGNSAPYQRLDLILDSLPHLKKNVHLVFTGEISKEYRREHDRIHYTGALTGRELVGLIKNARVLISTRMADGFPPMKILYYLLAKVPIVATDSTCHSSILTEKDAILCKPTPQDVALAIEKAIGSNINKGDEWKETLSPLALRKTMQNVYDQVLKREV